MHIRAYCEPKQMDAEDPLFILYTSGSTGKLKDVLHTIGGYLLFAALTFQWIFDYKEEDTHFSTTDNGWITGHRYIVYGPLYGPLAVGATSLMFLQFTTALPKTRSGKIMRRILRKIAGGETENLGDTSTLADPGVVNVLVKERP